MVVWWCGGVTPAPLIQRHMFPPTRLSKKLEATDNRLIKAQGQNAVAEKAYNTLREELLEEIQACVIFLVVVSKLYETIVLQALIDCKDSVVVPTADQIKLCQYKFFSLGAGMTRSCLSPSSLRSLGETDSDSRSKRSALDDLTWTRKEATGTPASDEGLGSQRALQIEAVRGLWERLVEQGEEASSNAVKVALDDIQRLESQFQATEEAKRAAVVQEDFIAAQAAKVAMAALSDEMDSLFSELGFGQEQEATWRTTTGTSPPATRLGHLNEKGGAESAQGVPTEGPEDDAAGLPSLPRSSGSELPAVPDSFDEF